jgi:hypothetical protein
MTRPPRLIASERVRYSVLVMASLASRTRQRLISGLKPGSASEVRMVQNGQHRQQLDRREAGQRAGRPAPESAEGELSGWRVHFVSEVTK